MLEVLTDPNGFFERKMGEAISFKTPLIILLVLGLLGAINAIIMVRKVISALPEDAAMFAQFGAVFGAIGAFIGVLFIWVIYAGIFYLISMVFNGEGSFKRVLEFVAYGFIPSIASSLIGIVVTSRALSTVEFSLENPELLQQTLLASPWIQASVVIGVIFLLWSANIWIFGLIHSRGISTKNAILTVGIPVGLYILYTLYSSFGVLV